MLHAVLPDAESPHLLCSYEFLLHGAVQIGSACFSLTTVPDLASTHKQERPDVRFNLLHCYQLAPSSPVPNTPLEVKGKEYSG